MTGICGPSNNTNIVKKDFYFEVGSGQVKGYRGNFALGVNNNLSSGLDQTIWKQGGLIALPDAATTFYISSTSVSDTANTFLLTLLDDEFNEVLIPVTPNGQTSVAVPGGTYSRLNKAFNITQNPGVPSVGDIYIATSNVTTGGIPDDADTILGKIVVGDENLMNAVYTTPKGCTSFTLTVRIWVGKGQAGTIKVFVIGDKAVPLNIAEFQATENTFENQFIVTAGIGEKTTVEIRGQAEAATIKCSADFAFIDVENELLA